MAQNREPPAYQEYASDLLAKKEFRLMSLEERGALYTIRLECWTNGVLPSDLIELAGYLRCDLDKFEKAFTDRVKSFLEIKNDSVTCPELDNYKKHLLERKMKQSNGGKKGAATTNSKYGNMRKSSENSLPSKPQVTRGGRRVSLVEMDRENQSKDKLLEISKWMSDYERESNGE